MQSDKFDDIEEILISILNEKTLAGVYNQFDCDADETVIREAEVDFVFECNLQENDNTETDSQSKIVLIDNEEIERAQKIVGGTSKLTNKRCNEVLNNEIASSECGNQNWKKLKVENLKRPLTTALRRDASKCKVQDNEEKGIESGESPKVTSKFSNRRRPMLTRALTSSDVAQKYNLLLDKRLELINKNLEQQDEHFKFQKEEQKLKLQLLMLEIEYKKTLLKSNFGIDSFKF